MIIGLLGKAGTGKTTVANHLVSEYNFQKISLAEPLKKMAMMIYGLEHHQVWGTQEEKETIDDRWGKSPRELLQYLGTDVCREHLGQDVWVDAMIRKVRATMGTHWVVDDLRFMNEANAIRKYGVVVKLECPDAPAAVNSGHASEQVDTVPFDFKITSRKSDGDLLQHVNLLMLKL